MLRVVAVALLLFALAQGFLVKPSEKRRSLNVHVQRQPMLAIERYANNRHNDEELTVFEDQMRMVSRIRHAQHKLRRALPDPAAPPDFPFSKQLMDSIRQLVGISEYCRSDLLFFFDQFYFNFTTSMRDLDNCANQSLQSCINCAPQAYKVQDLLWTTEALDSIGMGAIPPGILYANIWFLGNYKECINISVPRPNQGQLFQGKYCLADISWWKDPQGLCQAGGKNSSHAWVPGVCSAMKALHMGYCLPASCTSEDGHVILSTILSELEIGVADYENKTHHSLPKDNTTCVCAQVTCHERELFMKHDPKAIAMLSFAIFVIILMVIGTIYDYWVYLPIYSTLPDNAAQRDAQLHASHKAPEPTVPQFVTEPLTPIPVPSSTPLPSVVYQRQLDTKKEFYDKQSNFIKVILAFSMYTNGKKIFETRKLPGQVHCLHGVRFFSMAWVIFGHTYFWGVPTLDNLRGVYKLADNAINMIIFNATYSVDAFYVLSAFLLTFLWLKDAKRTKGSRIKQPLFWVMYYVHRYLRLTPIYAILLGLDVTLYRYAADGPLWDQDGLEPNYCRNSWWTNLLYLNNFLSLDEQCMSWTWYLANDMQFYIVTPIFLVVLWWYEYIGIALVFLTALVTGIVKAVLTVQNNFPPHFIATVDPKIFEIQESYWNIIYVKPYCRCGPYLMGILLGYALYKTNAKQFKMNKYLVATGWLLTTGTMLALLFGLFDYTKTGELPSTPAVALYAALCRTLWGAGVSWIIFASVSGYGGPINTFLSWEIWMPLSRITYCAYLIHPFIVHGTYDSRMQASHFDTHLRMVYYFFGHVIISYFLAFFVSLAFEQPVLILENLILGDTRRGPNAAPAGTNASQQPATKTEPKPATPATLSAASTFTSTPKRPPETQRFSFPPSGPAAAGSAVQPGSSSMDEIRTENRRQHI